MSGVSKRGDKGRSATTLSCFSPPVMLATFLIEICLAIAVLWKYKLTRPSRLAVLLLFFLALFQLCEYKVCGGWGFEERTWSRIGFAAISTLPALGYDLMNALVGRRRGKTVVAGYMIMASFIGYFLLAPSAFRGYACTGNYVIFQIGDTPTNYYAAYYFGFIAAAYLTAYRWLNMQQQTVRRKALAYQIRAVKGLVFAYTAFLLPAFIVNLINPTTIEAMPSILCGFAVLFAVVLFAVVLPAAKKAKLLK